MGSSRRVLADGWYSWHIPSFRALTDLIGRWPRGAQKLTWKLGVLRAVILVSAGSRYELIALLRSDRGWRSVLLLRALLGRPRKLVVLQFIDLPPRRRGAGAALDAVWRPVERWALRRALLRAQVLSSSERDLYAARFGLESDRFGLIPFAWRLAPTDAAPPSPPSARRGVVAAGRAMCDWPTLFAAARSTDWPLTVVCGAGDLELVESLNRDGRALVLTDLPREDTLARLRQAAVCVLALADGPVSHGQIRLCDATDAGAAVVATRISALDGYVEDADTALLVAPGDAPALRAAIERLLSDPDERDRLAARAFARAAGWTWERYLAAVEAFVLTGAADRPA